MARLSLFLLGSVQATLDGVPLTDFRTHSTRTLLVYLAMHPGQYFDRRFLAALLWPDSDTAKARTNLRQTLYRLRQALNDGPDGEPFLRLSHGSLSFNQKSDFYVDALAFADLLAANDAHNHPRLETCAACMARLQRGLDIYRGDWLTGFDLPPHPLLDEWRVVTQERLHSQAIQAMGQLAAYRQSRQEYAEAAHILSRLLAFEPWREEEHFQLLQVLALDGRSADALSHFDRFRQVLATELGSEPTTATVELAEEIRQGRFPPPEVDAAPSDSPIEVPAAHLAHSRLPLAEALFGRQAELERLAAWIRGGHCRVGIILGMGGIGKTALVTHTARTIAVRPLVEYAAEQTQANSAKPHQTEVLWRSLVNAPPLSSVLREWLQVLAHQPAEELPAAIRDQINLLVTLLNREPALLVLDNLESILEEGDGRGRFRPGYEEYEQLLQAVAEREHRGCLLLTSREMPQLLARLERSRSGVAAMHLTGLSGDPARRILRRWAPQGNDDSLDRLAERYSGNPLALELVAETIDALYDGDTEAFLATPAIVFEDIRDVLNQQFQRLTHLERTLLYWLAVEREPTTLQTLEKKLYPHEPPARLLASLRRLLHRSLIQQESGEGGVRFYLQNVITEYVTDRLVESACAEFEAGDIELLESHALLTATAQAFVVESQRRMILEPVAAKLMALWGEVEVGARLRARIAQLRTGHPPSRGYAAGNILNLMIQAGVDLRGMDFSGLTIRQAHLSNTRLPEVNFAGASLLSCSFMEDIGQIIDGTLSPDGRFLAAVSLRGELLLWRRPTHQPLLHLYLNVGSLWSVAFSPDGRQLVCAAGDGCLYFWRVVVDGEDVELIPTQVLTAHERAARSVAFRADGEQLASAGEDGKVRLWSAPASLSDSAPFQPERTLSGHTDRVFRVVYSPDGQRLASAGADTEIRLWDSRSGECLWTLQGHQERIAGLAFSPDGKRLVSGGVDREIRVWSVETGECLHVLRHHRRPLLSVAFSPDGRLLASAGHTPFVQLWETRDWQPVRRFQVADGQPEVWVLLFGDEGRELITGGDIAPLSGWDVRDGQCTFVVQNWRSEIYRVRFHPSGQWLIASDRSGQLLFWDLEKIDAIYPVLSQRTGNNAVFGIGFAAQGDVVISGSLSGSIRLWRLEERAGTIRLKLAQELSTSVRGLRNLTLTADERILLAISGWGELFIWQMAAPGELDSHPLHRIQAHSQTAFGLAVHPLEQLAATGGDDQMVRLWDIATGAAVDEFGGFQGRIVSVDFSPDGVYLAACDAAGVLLVWNVEERRVSHRLSLAVGESNLLVFVEDNALAVGGAGVISLWQLEADGTLTCQHRFSGHGREIEDLQRHPTYPLLASASSDGSARLWNIQTGESVAVWRNPGPYRGTNIHNVQGLTTAQTNNLLALGAVEIRSP